jgi:hypothetical protein
MGKFPEPVQTFDYGHGTSSRRSDIPNTGMSSLYACLHLSPGVCTIEIFHGAEPFLRSHQLLSYSRISQHFMEPEGSLLCSQEPSTGPCPKPEKSSPYYPILSLEDPSYYPPTYV